MSNFNRARRMETPRHSSRSSFLGNERVDDTIFISEINSNFGLSEPAPITNGGHPRFRILSADMVAIFESDHHQFTYQIEEPLDSHSLSYENLLLLEERMGNFNTGLSHEAICRLLRSRIYLSSSKTDEICVVCQAEYENEDRIGTLGCGHEFHADCIREWLILKNSCPICKSMALPNLELAI